METSTVNGVKIEYESLERRTDALHSWGFGGGDFAPLVRAPALERYRRICYHRRLWAAVPGPHDELL
jgi:hypothetical protein